MMRRGTDVEYDTPSSFSTSSSLSALSLVSFLISIACALQPLSSQLPLVPLGFLQKSFLSFFKRLKKRSHGRVELTHRFFLSFPIYLPFLNNAGLR